MALASNENASGGAVRDQDGRLIVVGANGSGISTTLSGAIPAGTALIGRTNVDPQTGNGLSISRTISAATTNATSVKASAGSLYGWSVNNVNIVARYLKLYDKATAPTVGTDTPVLTIPLGAASVSLLDLNFGIAFSVGIAFALTSGLADADTGAVAASEHVINLFYK